MTDLEALAREVQAKAELTTGRMPDCEVAVILAALQRVRDEVIERKGECAHIHDALDVADDAGPLLLCGNCSDYVRRP